MTLSAGDKAVVREIATEIKDTILEWSDKRIDEKIESHGLKCGHRRFMAVMTLFAGVFGGLMTTFGKWFLSKF